MGADAKTVGQNGNIGLAPLPGLGDAIVNIVESGVALRENGFSVPVKRAAGGGPRFQKREGEEGWRGLTAAWEERV